MDKARFVMIVSVMLVFLYACTPTAEISTTLPPPSTSAGISQTQPVPLVPDFAQIIVIPFENREFDEVIGNHQMPNYNLLAAQYTLLTQYYTIQHPSLPDQIESFGRTWKAYMEDMPSSCFIGNKGNYVQKHDPFIYFDSIRLDTARCQRSVVPLTDLSTDLTSGVLPDFAYSMPNLCNSAHNATSLNPFCSLGTVDDWLGKVVQKL